MQGLIVGDVNNKRKLIGLLDFQNKRVGVLRMTLRAGKVFGTFEKEASKACFSKVPKLFGRISGDIILFISSKRWRLEARNFAFIFIFIPFTTY